jgi:NADPH2:quinone reductase
VKAIRVHETGEPEVLTYEDVPDPSPPGPNEVLIRVRAVGLNFADHLMRIGAYPTDEAPFIPGLEAAGTVEAVGSEVRDLAPGEAVLSWGRRTYAELALAPSWAVCAAPEAIAFEQLAAIPVAFGTAWHALVTVAHLQAGERVLVHAVGSGVGSAALLLAKHLGARVIATAGQDWKLEQARSMGADATINYASADVAAEVARLTDGEGVHVVLEGVGRETFPASVKSLVRQGRLVIYGSPSGPRVEVDTRLAINRNLTLYGMSITTSPDFPDSIRSFARDGLPAFAVGGLNPVVDSVFPLADAAAAHRRMMDRAQFGKIILRVD